MIEPTTSLENGATEAEAWRLFDFTWLICYLSKQNEIRFDLVKHFIEAHVVHRIQGNVAAVVLLGDNIFRALLYYHNFHSSKVTICNCMRFVSVIVFNIKC